MIFCICMDVIHVVTKHMAPSYNVIEYSFQWFTKLTGYFRNHACAMEAICELTVILDRPRLRHITRGRALNYLSVTFNFFKLLCDANIIYFENKVIHGEKFCRISTRKKETNKSINDIYSYDYDHYHTQYQICWTFKHVSSGIDTNI